MDPNIVVEVQTPAILNAVAGLVAVTLAGLAVRIEQIGSRVKNVETVVSVIQTMHEHPDDSGFGTATTNRLLGELTTCCSSNCRQAENVWRSLDRVAHYIRHDFEERTGKKMPPPRPTRTEVRP